MTPSPAAPTQFAPRGATGRTAPPSPAPAPDLRAAPRQLLTEAALRRAWLAVKQAKGGAGVDGVTLARFAANLDEELAALRAEMLAGSYQPRPLRRVLVPKAGSGLRGLTIWTLRDRVAQRVVYDLIAPVFDAYFLPCSYGFRAGLGVDDAVQALVRHRDANLRWVVDADIRDCFDAIDRRRVAQLVGKRVPNRLLMRYIRAWLDARVLTGMDGRVGRAGAAQGGVLSPLFANIYLHEMDRQLTGQGLALVRYADDFVICCRRKAQAQAAQQAAARALARLGLELHPYKTGLRHFDQGFAWLGYFFIRNEFYRLAGGTNTP